MIPSDCETDAPPTFDVQWHPTRMIALKQHVYTFQILLWELSQETQQLLRNNRDRAQWELTPVSFVDERLALNKLEENGCQRGIGHQ